MRNLILFAVAFGVVLSETDVEELGMNVSEIDFKNYFGIPQETEQNSGFVKSEGFLISDLFELMNEEELKISGQSTSVQEEVSEETTSKEVSEEPVKEVKTEKAPAETKEEKAAKKEAEKAAKLAEKEKAKKDKEAAKTVKSTEPRKPGVIASILEIIQKSELPVNENQIVDGLVALFPDKTPDSMRNTVRAQIGGKSQPVRMEQEKKITFVITEVEGKEGEKPTKLYSVKA